MKEIKIESEDVQSIVLDEPFYFNNNITYFSAASGAVNMERDREVFLQGEKAGDENFFKLMLYHWQRPTLSLGFAQKADRLLNFSALNSAGVDWVHRCSGGKAVLHCNELTYAIVCSNMHPVFGGNLHDSYRKISATLKNFLNDLLVGKAEKAAENGENFFYANENKKVMEFFGNKLFSKLETSSGRLDTADYSQQKAEIPKREGVSPKVVCYAMSGFMEIMMNQRKLIGSAQKRGNKVFLQHGSLPLRRTTLQMENFFKAPLLPKEKAASINYAALFDDLPEDSLLALGDDPAVQQKNLALRLALTFNAALQI